MWLRIVLLIAVLASGILGAAPVAAASPSPAEIPVPGDCVEGSLPHGSRSLICVPAAGWNGDLIVFAHGYVAPDEPLGFYNLELPDGTYLPTLVQSLGYAFATTSYRRNGLAILEGVQDVRELVARFSKNVGEPGRAYITGASEGGAVTALLAESKKTAFDAGLSLCGPIGDFRKQVDYWEDFRALYDYFFPDVLPGDAVNIPAELFAGWDGYYQSLALGALAANLPAAQQLISVSGAPIDPADPITTAGLTTSGILWYNVKATEDGKKQLRGNPYDNTTRAYSGSVDDTALNDGVKRYAADPQALNALRPYNTTGNPRIPLITMHTTGDPIVPAWHQDLYQQKLEANGNTSVTQIAIPRYGHCSFTTTEVLAAFDLMIKATGQQMFVPPQFDITAAQAEMEGAELK